MVRKSNYTLLKAALILAGFLIVCGVVIIISLATESSSNHRDISAPSLPTPTVTATVTAPSTIPPTVTMSPSPSLTAPPSGPSGPVTGKPSPTVTVTYTVKPGDTLSSIADNFKLNGYQHLYEQNQKTIGDNPGLIRPGQVLVLEGT